MSFRSDRYLLPLLLCPTAVPAQGQSLDTIRPIQGDAERGKLLTIDSSGKVAATIGKKAVSRELSALRSIDLAVAPGPPLPRQGLVLLRTGFAMPALVREAEGRKIVVDSALADGRAQLSLSHVQAIRFARLEAEDDGGFGKYLRSPKADQDLIYIKTDTKIVQRSVRILGFADGAIRYEARGGRQRERRVSDLYGIVMARSSGFPPDLQPRPRVVFTLQGGSKVRGRLLALDAGFGVLELAEKATLKFHRARLRRITVESERLVFLTDLEPSDVRQTPAFRTKKPWLKNRAPMGDGIQLGGNPPKTMANGLVLAPKTSLTYDVDGKFDFFAATIGIDSRSTGPAHAIFRVKDGDKVLFESKPVTRQTEPRSIEVPIAKVRKLTIEADFGKNFDFGDHCVFAEARVIKRGS